LKKYGKKALKPGETMYILLETKVLVPTQFTQVQVVTTHHCYHEAKSKELEDDEAWELLKDQFQIGTDLTDGQKQELISVLRHNIRAFAKNKEDIGYCEVIFHEIDTGDARPVKQKPYRLSFAEEKEAHKQIAELVAMGKVKPSNSPWASPIVMVKKKNGTLRMCVDMRALNKVTKPWSYPLPYIQDVLDRLGKSRYFAVCDLMSGFWNIPIKESDKDKTAFCTRAGQWRWEVMPFGLINAPATFQYMMNTIFPRNDYQEFLEIFIDDLCVHTKAWPEFLAALDACLKKLIFHNLKLGVGKCKFAFSNVEYLGHIVSADGIKPDPRKVEAAMNLLPPTTVTEIKSFLGLVGYYRRFIRNFSLIARPMNTLTQKGIPFIWGSAQQKAFKELKDRLVNAPLLLRPDPNESFILDTDYQLYAIAAILSQKDQEGREHPVAYASKGLTKAEQKWSTYEGELFAIIWGIEYFRQYLDNGRNFLLRTDHKPLQTIQNTKNPSRKLAGWITKLQGYQFMVEYREGKKHANADGLSRARASHLT
jgi:hypothetical protein